jgi:hypothetical protein
MGQPGGSSGTRPGPARPDGPRRTGFGYGGAVATGSVKAKEFSSHDQARLHCCGTRRFTVIAGAACGYTDHALRRAPLAEDAQHSSQGWPTAVHGRLRCPCGRDPAMQPRDRARDT